MKEMRTSLDLIHVAFAAALAGNVAACAADLHDDNGSPHDAVSSQQQDIISNAKAPDATIDRLGLVQVSGGDCSGVLIGTRTALTARHCESTVGTPISFFGTTYTATQTVEPPPQFDTPWGPRDLEILHLDRDVVRPGTNTIWTPELPVWKYDLPSQVNGRLLCFGVGANQVVDGQATGNAASDFYGAVRTIAGVEDGVTYRIVAGAEPGDSGGPCFAPTWWNSQQMYALMSIASTSARDIHDDGTEGPGTDAAEVATGESGINDWINSNIN